MPEAQPQDKWWVAPPGSTPPAYCVALGATLRCLREAARRPRAKVARDVLDTSTSQLARYESGEAKPTLRVITDLCDDYEVNPIELLAHVDVATRPGAAKFAPLPDVMRFFRVMLMHDEAVPDRPAIERRRAKVRQQQMTEETSTS